MKVWLFLGMTFLGCNTGPSKEECSAVLQAIDSVKTPESRVFDREEVARLRQELSEDAKRVEAVPVKDKELQAAQLRYVSTLRASSSKIKQELADADTPKEAINLGNLEKEEIKRLCRP